jgi:hypothetical protein
MRPSQVVRWSGRHFAGKLSWKYLVTEHSSTSGSRKLTAGGRGNESSLGCFVRVVWPLFVPVSLILVGSTIIRQPRWTFSWGDCAYWGIVVGVVCVRYINVATLGALSSRQEPITARRFVLECTATLVVGAIVWVVLKSFRFEL